MSDLKTSIAGQRITLASGSELAYYDSAKDGDRTGNEQTVILLHGFCGSSAYWELAAPLLARHARVIAPDLRGQGLSSASGEGPYSMELYADDVAGLMDSLNIEKACLLGHSLGGYITLAFAEKYGDKLNAFGLVHSTPLPDTETAKENREKAAAAIRKDGIAAFVDGLVPKLFAPSSDAALIERAKQIGYGTSVAGAIGAALGMKARQDRSGVLESTALPLLLLAGVSDQIVPREKTHVVNGPHVTQALLSEAGHMGMLEQPEAFAEAVLSFLKV
ncbi:alpha/beta fold hydrolase [Paenibacillus sp. NEAU-GSW1]|uniref:alpha/beta fold hydrolase n=1 Tax=Paenibacillus sp. NEAU-GSW1 TaxID=2682486 RepID=UPI0012E157E6|nr:alpha/beta hydrolase [Paenibacillus sp. NEAU-GSW1]MUT68457.1 alpha/beta fold hydrolase [Paenibacillus sp. NEAU-GSW1]